MDLSSEPKATYYPTDPDPVPLTELGRLKCVYLSDRRAHRDPTIVWGTAIDAQPVANFIIAESRRANVLLSPVHVLVRAVAQSLVEHPHLNRKVIGRRVYPYNHVNIVIPLLDPGTKQVNPVFIEDVEQMTLGDIAMSLWNEARNRGVQAAEEQRREALRTPWTRFWAKVWRSLGFQLVLHGTSFVFALSNQIRRPSHRVNYMFNGASAMVNYLSFPGGSPPMLNFKPSSLPLNSAALTVTMAAPEWRAVVVDGQVVAQRMTPLFVKVDHRVAHSHEIAAFIKTLCRYMLEPCRLSNTDSQAVVSSVKVSEPTLSAAA